MKSIISQIKVCQKDFLCDVCACLGGAAFGIVCCLISDYLSNGGENVWERGIITFISFLFGIAVLIITGIVTVPFCFNMTVGMSSTRKEYLTGHTAVIILRFVTVYAMCGIIYLLEGYENISYYGIDMSIVFSPIMIAIITGGTAVILFAGACILKFGYKVIWIFGAVWMALCLMLSRVSSDYSKHTGSVFDMIGQAGMKIAEFFTPLTASIAGTAVTGFLFFVSVKMLLNQKVQF